MSADRPTLGTVAGFVLAGGRSRRMGCDKALLTLEGIPLAQRAAEQVARVAGSACLVGPPERLAGLGYEVIPDDHQGLGPAGGIATALRHSAAEWNLVVACDMPYVPDPLLILLLAEIAGTDADCIVPVTPDGASQPLAAIYRRTALPLIEVSLQREERKLRSILQRFRVCQLATESYEWSLNVNTPAEWAELRPDHDSH